MRADQRRPIVYIDAKLDSNASLKIQIKKDFFVHVCVLFMYVYVDVMRDALLFRIVV